MLADGKTEGVVRVREGKPEDICVMSKLDLGAEPQLNVSISVLAHLLQNTAFFGHKETLFTFSLSVCLFLLLLQEETNKNDQSHE